MIPVGAVSYEGASLGSNSGNVTADLFSAAANTKGAWILFVSLKHDATAGNILGVRIKTSNIPIAMILTSSTGTAYAIPVMAWIPAGVAVEMIGQNASADVRVAYKLL